MSCGEGRGMMLLMFEKTTEMIIMVGGRTPACGIKRKRFELNCSCFEQKVIAYA